MHVQSCEEKVKVMIFLCSRLCLYQGCSLTCAYASYAYTYACIASEDQYYCKSTYHNCLPHQMCICT